MKNNKMMTTRVHVRHSSSWEPTKVRIEASGEYQRIQTIFDLRRMSLSSTRIEGNYFPIRVV